MLKGHRTKRETLINKPPKWAADLFELLAKDTKIAYENSKNNPEYPLDRVANLSQETLNNIRALQDSANNYKSNYQLHNALQQPTSSDKNLADIAAGKHIGQNPFFKETLKNVMDETITAINSQMSGLGRYGSGANSAILAKKLGNIAQQAQNAQYNKDMDHMLQANNQIDRAKANQINVANDLYKGQSNAFLNAMIGAQAKDKYNQNRLNYNYNKWQNDQNKEWHAIEKLLHSTRNSAGNYGSRDKFSQSNKDIFSNCLGFLQFSDKRLKENIKRIGIKNNIPIYEFNYINDSTRYVGVLAQEIQKLVPEAVYASDNGYLMVDYKKLGFNMERIGE